MKEKLPAIIAVISCILTVICLVQIADLNAQIKNLSSEVNTNLSNIRSDIVGISNTVADRMEQQSNLIADSLHAYAGDPDMDTLTVPFTYTVTPKEYDPQSTKASLTVGEKSYPMTLKNGSFTVTFDLPLFSSTVIDSVQLETNGVIQTQPIQAYFAPKDDFFPSVNASYSGHSSITPKNDIATKVYSGNVTVDIKQSEIAITSLVLYQSMSGETTAITELPLDASGSVEYAMNNTAIRIPYGEDLELYVEATDRYGLRYRSYIDRESIGTDGTPQKTEEFWVHSCQIYSADGEFLYGPKYTEVQ